MYRGGNVPLFLGRKPVQVVKLSSCQLGHSISCLWSLNWLRRSSFDFCRKMGQWRWQSHTFACPVAAPKILRWTLTLHLAVVLSCFGSPPVVYQESSSWILPASHQEHGSGLCWHLTGLPGGLCGHCRLWSVPWHPAGVAGFAHTSCGHTLCLQLLLPDLAAAWAAAR